MVTFMLWVYYFFLIMKNSELREKKKKERLLQTFVFRTFLEEWFHAQNVSDIINVPVVTLLLKPQWCAKLFSSIRAGGWVDVEEGTGETEKKTQDRLLFFYIWVGGVSLFASKSGLLIPLLLYSCVSWQQKSWVLFIWIVLSPSLCLSHVYPLLSFSVPHPLIT